MIMIGIGMTVLVRMEADKMIAIAWGSREAVEQVARCLTPALGPYAMATVDMVERPVS